MPIVEKITASEATSVKATETTKTTTLPTRITSKLSAASPVFVPAYSQVMTVMQPATSFLSEELELDLAPRASSSALANICNQLAVHIDSGKAVAAAPRPAATPRTSRSSRRAAAAAAVPNAAASKRPSTTKHANAPSMKKMRTCAAAVDETLLAGLPLVRSGVSNLLDDMEIKPAVVAL